MIRNLCVLLLVASAPAYAATIIQADVTSNLDGTIFFDDARTGGSDATANEGSTITVQRFFDFDGDGTLATPGPGVVTIESWGFATSGSATANDATQLDLTFIYLGVDELAGGGDDVTIGSERVDYTHVGAGEYIVDLDTDPSAMIDGLGNRFQVVVAPVDNDGSLDESIRIKSRPSNEQSFDHNGAVMSISGSFVAIPEPTSAALALLLLMTAGCGRDR